MSVKIKEKDLLFIVVNAVTIISGMAFLTLDYTFHLIGGWAELSGVEGLVILAVMLSLFAEGLFSIIIIITGLTDIWWIIRKYNERNKGWL